MYKLLSTLCLFLLAGSLSAQKLTGVVYDKTNQEPVAGAHVYIEGSSLYDVTDSDGKFEIRVNSVVNLPLIISHISYQTQTVNDPFHALPDTIFVDEKENLLGEVIVETGRYTRKQLLQSFRREFLGTSAAAKSCVIENEDKIGIWFDSQTHILTASCDEPIVLINQYLAYKLYLTLNKFEATYPGQRLGVGTPVVLTECSTFFEDLTPSNKKL